MPASRIRRRADDDPIEAVSGMAEQDRVAVMDLAGWSPNIVLLCAKMRRRPGYAAPGARGQTRGHKGIGPHDLPLLESAARAGAAIACASDAALADIARDDAEFGHIRILLAGDPILPPRPRPRPRPDQYLKIHPDAQHWKSGPAAYMAGASGGAFASAFDAGSNRWLNFAAAAFV